MADELKLSVQTVSRAYEELGRRGLITGEIGRGSFVQTPRREMHPPYLPDRLGEVIDLSILKPVCEPMHVEKLKEALGWLAQNLPARSALSFRPNVVFPAHAAAAVEWLRACGLETLGAERHHHQRRDRCADRGADERCASPVPPLPARRSLTTRCRRLPATMGSRWPGLPSTGRDWCRRRWTRRAGKAGFGRSSSSRA